MPDALKPAERAAMVTLGLVATVTAVSSTWAASKRGLDLRLFRIFIGGVAE